MKIVGWRVLQADGGLKSLSFLRLETDTGLVGWSEFSEFIGTQGLTSLVQGFAAGCIGEDPRGIGRIAARMRAAARVAAGGMNAQAAAAIENACLDIKAKALGVPVYELFGGAHRDRLPVYWSHCGTYRVRNAALFGGTPVRAVTDFVGLGREVAARGVKALKTNIIVLDDGPAHTYQPGFGAGRGHPERTLEPRLIEIALAQLRALREGAGDGVQLMLDLNFNFRSEGCRRIAQALQPLGLAWLEVDLIDPTDLRDLRLGSATPIASLETIYHRQGYRPYLEARAVDIAIIDPMWNGFFESTKIADLADAFDVAVSTHAYSSNLALAMGAHLAAVTPNLRFVEMDFDQPPWNDSLYTAPLQVEDGYLHLPTGPGWGIDVDEAAIAAHPPRQRPT